MRILVATITFALTVGILFLFENYKASPKEENYAQIIETLKNQGQSDKTASPKPTIKIPQNTATPIARPSQTPSSTANIPTISPTISIQSSPAASPTPTVQSTTITPSPPVPSPTPSPSSSSPLPTTTQTSCGQEQVNINTAPKSDLLKIKHIGDARAEELITLRPFISLDDLIRIKGIGPARVEDIKAEGNACL